MKKTANGKEFAEKVSQLMEVTEMNKLILKMAEKAYNSGAIDTENITDDSFIYPKVVLSAILENLFYEYRTMTEQYREEMRNVMKFI